MLVFVLNQSQKANTGKIQTPVYENVREFGLLFGEVFLYPESLFSAAAAGKGRPFPAAQETSIFVFTVLRRHHRFDVNRANHKEFFQKFFGRVFGFRNQIAVKRL